MTQKYIETDKYYCGKFWGVKVFIRLGNPCQAGYFKKRTRSYRTGLSNDGLRNEWSTEEYNEFIPIDWDERYNKHLPEGYERPPLFKWPEEKNTHCELCEKEFNNSSTIKATLGELHQKKLQGSHLCRVCLWSL